MDNNLVLRFITNWIIVGIIILVFDSILGQSFVVGNINIPTIASLILTSFLISAVSFSGPYITKYSGYKLKGPKEISAVALALNMAGIWIIKRLADFTGLGIENNLIVIALAIFTAATYYLVLTYIKK